jgi:inhibitor of KinA sporulation pathway (predicted exonuclease)
MKNNIIEIPQKTFIITDLEATCDNNPNFPKSLSEPIEIGAVAVNENLEIVAEFQTFIKPTKTELLSDFCKELTHIKQSDVDNAPKFKTAYNQFEKWFLTFENPIFCSWGGYDYRCLKRECEQHNLRFHFSSGVNLKNLFYKKQKLVKEVGLGKAMNIAKMKFIGTPHRGIDDAKNIARLLEYSYYDKNINKK